MAERKQQARLIQRFQSGGKQGISQFHSAAHTRRTSLKKSIFIPWPKPRAKAQVMSLLNSDVEQL